MSVTRMLWKQQANNSLATNIGLGFSISYSQHLLN